MDWKSWQRRWDRQQERYCPREQSLEAIVRCVEAVVQERGIVLDLACGCGSVTARLLEKLPELKVVGVDLDPVLLQIARDVFAENWQARWDRSGFARPAMGRRTWNRHPLTPL